VSSGVTKKTRALIAGEGGGGKRAKAEKLGTPVWDEQQFLALLRDPETAPTTSAEVDPDSAGG
jgi:DNA ligase (NAD+)